jgi:hypothetical protein
VSGSDSKSDRLSGFVSPANYSRPDIICHVGGTAPPAYGPVRAGDRIHMQWNGWPIGHVGPNLKHMHHYDFPQAM